MDKTITGMLAVASVLAIPAAHAANAVPSNLEAAMRADSYADLLKPIPNAAALLKASAAAPATAGQEADPMIQQAQVQLYVGPPRPAYYPPTYYYRPHHHRYWYRHHHHHHHHHKI